MEKFICIHGHFYQPPRENPWLETLELQESAAPYHDWNERITAECYGPNSRARVLDAHGKIAELSNNYQKMSFNFGPTLLSWAKCAVPLIHEHIVEADKASRERFSGHGSALAQVYNHMILPLANEADKKTQILWGIKDFEFRFDRFPEGMWLPETASDTESLEALAEAGMKFTIMSPFQAKEVRQIGEEEWTDVDGGRVNPRHPYVIKLPSGREIAVFFYDGTISRAVAFEKLLMNGGTFAGRLMGGFTEHPEGDELVHIATDGESYGHHFRYGDMALAWALREIEQNPHVKLTNYGEFLATHPPQFEARIHEKSAWSCSHGVGRWCTDCGCNSGGHPRWNQAWRGPLRQAFDWLRDVTAPLYANQAARTLADPWKARDLYLSVILDRSPESREKFFAECAVRPLEDQEQTQALKLLELQRHAMLMYTSCGWFFDELSGIETVQSILYSGRVVELSKEVFGLDLEGPFLERLALAKSNIPEHGDGRRIYNKWVRPSMINWRQATAHYAIGSIFRSPSEPRNRVFVFRFEDGERELVASGKTRLLVGHTHSTSEITCESSHTSFAVLYMGEHNLTAGVRDFKSEQNYRATVDELKAAFDIVDLPKVIRLIIKHFGDPSYSLTSLFKDEQLRVVHELLQSTLEDLENRYRRIAEQYVPLMKFLGPSAKTLLPAVETASNFVIRIDLFQEFRADMPNLDKLRRTLGEALAKGEILMDEELSYAIKLCLQRLIRELTCDPPDLQKMRHLRELAELVRDLPLELNLWEVQNAYWEMMHWSELDVIRAEAKAGSEEAQEWHQEFVRLGDCLGFSVEGT
jgi:alpha-amylase/alpha-mannosidase (GH57 family)